MTAFLRRQWYAVAWADEVAPGEPLARTLLGEPVLIWRFTDGGIAALADICPHRWAPLNKGQVDDAGVRCGYHGLKFDRTGQCIDNPHGPVLHGMRVRSYPMVERHAMLWIWLAREDAGDPAAIPDLSFVDRSPPTALSKGYMYTAAGHKLLEDNILDLSHADYLHPDTLGGGTITRTRASVEERGDRVFVQWLSLNEQAIPIFRPLLDDPDAPADMWTEVLWHPNGVMTLHTGATAAGGSPGQGIYTWNAHIMTPETERTTHYFYVNTRNYAVDDAEYNASLAVGLRHAFETEDKPMIEAQQRLLGDRELFDLNPRLMQIDSGSTRARRTYDRLLTAERARRVALTT